MFQIGTLGEFEMGLLKKLKKLSPSHALHKKVMTKSPIAKAVLGSKIGQKLAKASPSLREPAKELAAKKAARTGGVAAPSMASPKASAMGRRMSQLGSFNKQRMK